MSLLVVLDTSEYRYSESWVLLKNKNINPAKKGTISNLAKISFKRVSILALGMR